MKTNKKVLVILLAFAGAQSPVLAKKKKNSISASSGVVCESYETGKINVSVCVNTSDPQANLSREDLETIKSLSKNLLIKKKRLLENLNNNPKAILMTPIDENLNIGEPPSSNQTNSTNPSTSTYPYNPGDIPGINTTSTGTSTSSYPYNIGDVPSINTTSTSTSTSTYPYSPDDLPSINNPSTNTSNNSYPYSPSDLPD